MITVGGGGGGGSGIHGAVYRVALEKPSGSSLVVNHCMADV